MSSATAIEPQTSTDSVRGVGFALCDTELVIPIDQVQEIVSFDSVTPVPLTKPWLMGVTSIRSEAYTVCDLDSFITGMEPAHDQQRNIIVLRAAEMRCALKVKRIIGLRQFNNTDGDPQSVDVVSQLRPYIDGLVDVSGNTWCRFNVARLLTNPEFVRAELDEHTEPVLAS